jgi:UDP-glucose 4-epimerase
MQKPAPHTPDTQILAVTGGAGFVGSHLIRRLLSEYPEATIVSIDNYLSGTPANHVDSPRAIYLTASTVEINDIWDQHGLPAPSAVLHLG